MAEIPVSFLLDQLTPFLQEEANLLCGVHEEVEDIRKALEQIKFYLKDADTKEEIDELLKIWVCQVRDVAYQTEDVVEEFMLRLAKSKFYGCLRKVTFFIKNLKAHYQIASEIRRIKPKVNEVVTTYYTREYNKNVSSSSTVVSNVGAHVAGGRGGRALIIEEAELVGIEEPTQKLIRWLLDGDHSYRKVVSVVGMGGMGKTTLVKNVCEDEQVKIGFQSHAWITLPQTFNDDVELAILKEMIEQLQKEIKKPVPQIISRETKDSEKLRADITEFLQERRYVVVLDNVWSTQAWNALNSALPRGNLGSRVLLTTRIHKVALAASTKSHGYMHEMTPLTGGQSWDLFCKKTFQDQCCPEHLKELASNILSKCEGLPLAIVAIAGVLSLKEKNIIEFDKVQRNLNAELGGGDEAEQMIKRLYLSYYELPYHLKICFLYLSIFPESYEIEKTRVIRLWIAEQFVQKIAESSLTLEEVAEDCFTELFNRSLIQVAKKSLDEKPRTCRINDVLRQIILSKSKDQNIETLAGNPNDLPESVRRLAIYNCSGNAQENKSFRRLRSLLVLGDSCIVRNSLVSSLISGGSKLLKVLDLRGAVLETFPEEICELLHLRYLNLRDTKVGAIPKSIKKLRNLETLDLRGTKIIELPIEMGKLGKLRHLLVYDEKLYGGCKAPAEIGNLTSLQKLVTIEANQSNGSSIMPEVGKLTQLRTLYITSFKREDGTALRSSLEKLTNLRSLTVLPIKENDLVDVGSLSSGHRFLQKLYLRGRLEQVPNWIASLHSLIRVWLQGSGLMDDSLQCLRDLPNLLELALFAAYDGEELCFKAGGFQKLKRLQFDKLRALRSVRVENGALPCLVMLSIKECDGLEEVPSGFEHLVKLESLQIDGITESWVGILESRYSKGEKLWKTTKGPKVRINGALV